MFQSITLKLKNIIKILFINLLVTLLLILIIEIFFGYWFDKDNLGPYVREHRLRKNTYVVNYEGKSYEFIYKRNYYGFRGEEIELKKINAILVGGSTTDERYKPEKFTITEQINNKIKSNNQGISLINAGIEGQSTRGHLANIKFWFSKLNDFHPKYIIYYIGINDQFVNDTALNEFDGIVLEPRLKQRLYDNLKSRSFIYDEIRKIKHKYINSEKKILYDFNKSFEEYKNKKIDFLSYKNFLKKNNLAQILSNPSTHIKNYLIRIDLLYNETVKLGAIPIFVNQLAADGFNNNLLATMNIFLINHCKTHNYHCIDLASELEAEQSFWWDGVHTTPQGSDAISKIISQKLIKIFNSN